MNGFHLARVQRSFRRFNLVLRDASNRSVEPHREVSAAEFVTAFVAAHPAARPYRPVLLANAAGRRFIFRLSLWLSVARR